MTRLRAPGEHADGFRVAVTRTIGVPVQRLDDAFTDEELRARCLPGAQPRVRTATAPRSAGCDWADGKAWWRERLAALRALSEGGEG